MYQPDSGMQRNPATAFNGGSFMPQYDANTQHEFDNYAAQARTAATAPYGSIASRYDPNQFGSIASRKFDGAFGPTGALNPTYQADQAHGAASAADGMRRRDASNSATQFAAMQGQFTANALGPQFDALGALFQQHDLLPDPVFNNPAPLVPNGPQPLSEDPQRTATGAGNKAGGWLARWTSGL